MAESDEMRLTRNDRDEIGGLQVYSGSMLLDSTTKCSYLCLPRNNICNYVKL
jgi:hypothetical protein